MMRAVLATTDTSARMPATRPAPTAGPWMAETMGFEQLMTLKTRSVRVRMTRVRVAYVRHEGVEQLKEPPAEKALPAPRRTATRVSGSRSTSSQMSASSRCTEGPTALRPGPSMVMRSTPSDGWSMTSPG